MNDNNFIMVEQEKTKKNYLLSIVFFIIGLISLLITYAGPQLGIEFHFVVPGTALSYGWFALVFAIYKLIKPSTKKVLVKKKVSVIHHAISNNDIESLKSVLNNGANIEINDPITQNTPLIHAAHIGNSDMLNLLLEKGAQINSVGNFNGIYQGANALFITALKMDFENSKLLLEKGIDINHQNDEGGTVLLSAVNRLSHDIATFLVVNGADPNIQNKEGDTASIVAARLKSRKILEIFIDNSVNIDKENTRGETPLRIAIRAVEKDLFDYLTKNGLKNTGRQRNLISFIFFNVLTSGLYSIFWFLSNIDELGLIRLNQNKIPTSIKTLFKFYVFFYIASVVLSLLFTLLNFASFLFIIIGVWSLLALGIFITFYYSFAKYISTMAKITLSKSINIMLPLAIFTIGIVSYGLSYIDSIFGIGSILVLGYFAILQKEINKIWTNSNFA